jgi:hypothetical protein
VLWYFRFFADLVREELKISHYHQTGVLNFLVLCPPNPESFLLETLTV